MLFLGGVPVSYERGTPLDSKRTCDFHSRICLIALPKPCRVTSLIRTPPLVGPYGSPMPGDLWWVIQGGVGVSYERGTHVALSQWIWSHQIGEPGIFLTRKLTDFYRESGVTI
jgi:hypothetical protein